MADYLSVVVIFDILLFCKNVYLLCTINLHHNMAKVVVRLRQEGLEGHRGLIHNDEQCSVSNAQ